MSLKKLVSVSLVALGAFAVAPSVIARAETSTTVASLDPDNDGTVTQAEAEDAAGKKFATLDADKDGTVDMKEAGGALDSSAFKAADADKDGTIDKTEYTAAVASAFKEADPDGDGTLDAKELKSPAGAKVEALAQ